MKNLFAKRLKELRKAKKLTREELGAKVGTNEKNIYNWEMAGKIPSDLDIYIALADYFEVTIDYLMGKTDNPKTEIIQTTFLDNKGEQHTLKIENEMIKKDDKISLKELDMLIQILKKLGFDPDKINLSTF